MNKPFMAALLFSVLATVSLRSLPILLLSRLRFRSGFYEWLSFVPAAIMTALVAMELLIKPDFAPNGWSLSAYAALGSLLIGATTRNLFLTVLSGTAVFIVLQWMLG